MQVSHYQKLIDLGLHLEGVDAKSMLKNQAGARAIEYLGRADDQHSDEAIREYVALAHKAVDEGGDGY